jgi:quercetin dioxygenase-like cupin family protein
MKEESLMKKIEAVLSVVFLLAMSCAVRAADQQPAPSGAPEVQMVSSPSAVKWGPAPPVVASGAQAAVLSGDPFKDGAAYTLRLKMPDGYRIAPHWHPTDENVTVISGTLGAGMGDKFDPAAGTLLKPGGFVCMPKGMHHYAWAKGPTVVQVHGIGPFAFTYVNPADDPRNQH